MVTLAPLTYGKVTGRFLAVIGDGLDADTSPDAVPLSGSITFTSGAAALLVATATPDPATIIPTPIIATLDVNGYLTFNGAQGVYLLATNDTSQNPTSYTYKANFNFTYLGTPVSYPSFSFSLPAGSVTDLTTVAPSPASTGTSTGGGGTWGSIIGTLAAQTDLTSALAAKATDANIVHLTGAETIAGVKTLTSSPVVPTPSSAGQAANKGYVDGFVGTYTNMEAGSSFVVDYVFGSTNAYPTRPTARTDLIARWRGPSAPTIGGGYALTGDEYLVKTS